jgi:adenine/guanine phosphoribosyltransferase-like PRPP-binding protein
MVGFSARRDGYEVKGVWAPFQALKDVDAENPSGRAPEGVTANDMIRALKTMGAVRTKAGVVLVPSPGLQGQVAARAAALVARRFRGMGIDLVVTPQSSSGLASAFGSAIADLLGAEHVSGGLVKSGKVELELPPHVVPTRTGRDAAKAKERWEKKAARAARGEEEMPSLRSTFKPSIRRYVRGFVRPHDRLAPYAGGGRRVLIADDVVTTGSTHLESKRALERLGLEVVGMVAIFKEQPAR